MPELTPAELERVTGRKRKADQAKQLRNWGVGHLVRADGSALVTWEAINAVLLGKAVAQPDFGAR